MGKTRAINPGIIQFFADPVLPLHRQYLALRSFYFEGKSVEDVAALYGYSTHAVYSMAKIFKNKHDNKNDVILEFMDFYREGTGNNVSYLVFDSKFTTLENLGRINRQGIKFITIQRRCKNLNEKAEQIHFFHLNRKHSLPLLREAIPVLNGGYSWLGGKK